MKQKNQDKILRRTRLSTGANFVHVYTEIWDKGILKFNKFLRLVLSFMKFLDWNENKIDINLLITQFV